MLEMIDPGREHRLLVLTIASSLKERESFLGSILKTLKTFCRLTLMLA